MELLKVNEFAALYNLSISKVRAMCQTGELPACKIGVGWRIDREKAEAILTDLFNQKIAYKPKEPHKTRLFRAKTSRKFDFLAELDKAKGSIL